MSPVAQAVLESWQFPPGVMLAITAAGALYWRGFRKLHAEMPARFPIRRLIAFIAGLVLTFIAIASPLDALGEMLLQVHMVQHVLLMFMAPPLLLLGAPQVPLLRGLPRSWARDGLGPFLGSPALRKTARALSHPLVCWLALFAATWLWHTPAAYQAALRSPRLHHLEHACFFTAGLMFWWPVIQPWPSLPHWPRWAMIPYLLAAEIENGALSALLTMSGYLIYPFYAAEPRLFGISPLNDQVVAGAIMWVPTSLFFLIPAAAIVLKLLGPQNLNSPGLEPPPTRRARPPRRRFDLLRAPIAGRAMRSRYFRRGAQVAMLIAAAAVVADGLLGPRMAPMNLAGVLPWTYWRAMMVIGLLVAGNVFCMACPFTLPREVARRIGPRRWRWPAALRSKYPAVTMLALFFVAYEVFSLWNSPALTAWIIIGYFVAALLVDTLFSGASFCKYVCPIGNFQFISSLVSPLEVRARSAQVCATCTTHDCLRGNGAHQGCELELFVPRKQGNLDCTFCLDCVKACPHDNVGIIAVAPGRTLLADPFRSSLGRLSRRPDIVALAMIVTFAAFANAAAMVAPVARWETIVAARLGLASTAPIAGALLILMTIGVPAIAYALAAIAGHAPRIHPGEAAEPRRRFALCLVPLGLAMWSAHFLFHLGTGLGTALPAIQQAMASLGHAALGQPRWTMAPAIAPAHLLGAQLIVLDCGLLASLYLAWRIARGYVSELRAALRLILPWAIISLALYAGGVWIMLKPMQMRGIIMPAPTAARAAAQPRA